jgi:hypothetical protein
MLITTTTILLTKYHEQIYHQPLYIPWALSAKSQHRGKGALNQMCRILRGRAYLFSKRVQCFQFGIEVDAEYVSQSADINQLVRLVGNYRTSSGDLFRLAFESDVNVFLLESMAFSVPFTIKVGSVDIVNLLTALEAAWEIKLGQSVELQFVWQEETFSPDGCVKSQLIFTGA